VTDPYERDFKNLPLKQIFRVQVRIMEHTEVSASGSSFHGEQGIYQWFQPTPVGGRSITVPSLNSRSDSSNLHISKLELGCGNRQRRVPHRALRTVYHLAFQSAVSHTFLLGAAGEQEENALERPLVDRRRN
jgi:hypothetical protein